jgi:hypothetical protein
VKHAVLYNEIRKIGLTFKQASLLKIKFKNDYGTIESIISFDKQIYFLINIIKKIDTKLPTRNTFNQTVHGKIEKHFEHYFLLIPVGTNTSLQYELVSKNIFKNALHIILKILII